MFFFIWAHFQLLVSTEGKCFPFSFKILNRLHHASPTLYGTEHNSQERVLLSSLAILQWLHNTWHVIYVILRLGSLHRSCFLRGVLRDETEKAARETTDRVPQFIVSAKIQVLKSHKNKSSVKTEPYLSILGKQLNEI